MMRDFFLEVLVPFGLILLLVFGALFGVLVGADYLVCKGFESATGTKTKFAWGCYVEVDGKFVPKEYVYGDAHELRVKK